MNKERLKHLEFIQNVITRMNTNSFLIKGWMITLVSALLVLTSTNTYALYPAVPLIPIVAFWMLDAFYLSQERQYRALYHDACTRWLTDFSMDARKYNTGKRTWNRTLRSKTLITFYPTILLAATLITMCSSHHARLIRPGPGSNQPKAITHHLATMPTTRRHHNHK